MRKNHFVGISFMPTMAVIAFVSVSFSLILCHVITKREQTFEITMARSHLINIQNGSLSELALGSGYNCGDIFTDQPNIYGDERTNRSLPISLISYKELVRNRRNYQFANLRELLCLGLSGHVPANTRIASVVSYKLVLEGNVWTNMIYPSIEIDRKGNKYLYFGKDYGLLSGTFFAVIQTNTVLNR